MAVADIANGVGARIDAGTWTFLNTDLSVHIFRDEVGPIGRSARILEVRER